MKRILFIILLVSLTAQLHAVLIDDMIAKWSFDDASGNTAVDSTGTYDCTISNGGWDTGLLDGAATGSGAFIGTVGAIPELNGAEKISFACWVNPNRATCDGWAALISQSTGQAPYFFAGIDSYSSCPAGYLDWDIRICGRAVRSNEGTNTAVKLIDNQWNLVIFTFDYTLGNVPEALTIWINGVKVQGANPANADAQANDYYSFGTPGNYSYNIGQDRADGGRRFGGLLDETALWTRVLTDDEIADMWNNGQGRLFEIRGIAHTPTPDGTEVINSEDVSSVSWVAPVDANIVSIDGYDVYWSDVDGDFTGEAPAVTAAVQGASTTYTPAELTYEKNYFWRIDTHVIWDSNDLTGTASTSSVVEGSIWAFETLSGNPAPVVNAGADVLTAMEMLPAVLSGTASDVFGDINNDSFAWTITELPGIAPETTSPRMLDRAATGLAVNSDLLKDWVGATNSATDTMPVVLTLSGVPIGTYTWTSYHHDQSDQTGDFMLAISDSDGTEFIFDSVSAGEIESLDDVTTVTATVNSDGGDIIIVVESQEFYQSHNFVVFNGFELTSTTVAGDPVKIDFGKEAALSIEPGFEVYNAADKDLATYTAKTYSAFNGVDNVTLSVEFGGPAIESLIVASAANTTADPANPTADVTTNWPGAYTVQLIGTDEDLQPSEPDTVNVRVAANACVAAVINGGSYNYYDSDRDCDVDINDFAAFVLNWLDDRNISN